MLPVMPPVIAVRRITRRGRSTVGSAYLYVVREEPQHRQASHISCWETARGPRSLKLDGPAIRRHHQTGSRRISPSAFLATTACNWRRQWIENWSHTDASLSQLQHGEHRRAHVAPSAPSPCCVHRTPRARSTLRTAARHHSRPTPSAHHPRSHSTAGLEPHPHGYERAPWRRARRNEGNFALTSCSVKSAPLSFLPRLSSCTSGRSDTLAHSQYGHAK
jgi:hypothetical protein